MTDLDRPGSARRGVGLPQEPRIGTTRRSLWQCGCLRWNRQADEACTNCAKPRQTAPDRP